MDSVVFKDWFLEFFVKVVTKYLKKCGLPIKAALLIDNPSSYTAITVKFFSLNVTALIQPINQSVLENKAGLQTEGVKSTS